MRIYISGPMTGQKDLNRKAFADVAFTLQSKGHFVINPHELAEKFGTVDQIANSFKAYYEGAAQIYPNGSYRLAQSVMDAELAAVRSCDAIYLLRGWESSRGARKELSEAIAHGLSIILEPASAEATARQAPASAKGCGAMKGAEA